MDPVTIIGAAGAVIGIIDVVGKTIKSLRELHDQRKEADMNILILMSQLTSLRAALNKISEWISSDLANIPQHHQLIIDLEDSITCCRILVRDMDDQISKANRNGDAEGLDNKIRVVWEDKASKNFQKFIQRQTSALTLLLTACNWYILPRSCYFLLSRLNSWVAKPPPNRKLSLNSPQVEKPLIKSVMIRPG